MSICLRDVAGRPLPEREQTRGALQDTRPDRDSDQDVVSEQKVHVCFTLS